MLEIVSPLPHHGPMASNNERWTIGTKQSKAGIMSDGSSLEEESYLLGPRQTPWTTKQMGYHYQIRVSDPPNIS